MKPMAEQVSMFSPDSWSGKTSLGLSVPMEVRTSGQSWKKLAGSQTQPLLFLDLRTKDDGQARESSSGTVFRWPGGSMTHVGGESRRDGEGSASLPTSTDTQPPRYCSIVNWGEKPMVPVETKLSDILETNPDPKYNLSPKACQGILNRAARRGKELPEMLRAALERQAKAIPSETTTTDGLSGNSPCVSTPQPEETDSRTSSEGIETDTPENLAEQSCLAFKLGNSEKARSIGCEEEMSPTLNSECGGNKPAVCYNEVQITSPINRSNPKVNDPAPTLNCDSARAICIQWNCIDRADNAGCNGKGWNDEDVSYTLNTIDRPAVYDGSRRHDYQEFGEVAGTVQAQFGTGGNNTPIVVYDARGNGDGETVPTMTGDHNNRVTDYTAICITGSVTGTLDASYYKGAGARNGQERPVVYCIGNGQSDNTDIHDKCPTLSTMHDQQAVMVTAVDCCNGRESEVNGTLQAKDNGGSSLNLNNVCREGTKIRRLTPLECERLQGYPDGWVFIGDWTDENGKKHKEADAPMYKALGNSIALPFWYWLLNRISAFCTEKTMGSLFDGIGGFPLCWQIINGDGSCRWSSEIEPFCIAVTTKHFGDEEKGIKGDWTDYGKFGNDES